MELNKVLLVGNLTRDPESRFLPSGAQVCKLGLASNRRFSKKDGEKGEETLFVDVEVWGRQAETCAQYLQRGSMVLVEGRLRLDQYQAQDGSNRRQHVVVAERVQFGPRAGNTGGGGGGGRDEYDSGPSGRSGGAGRSDYGGGQGASRDRNVSEPGAGPSYDDGGFDDRGGTEDDIPF